MGGGSSFMPCPRRGPALLVLQTTSPALYAKREGDGAFTGDHPRLKRQDIVAGAVDELLLTRLALARDSPISVG